MRRRAFTLALGVSVVLGLAAFLDTSEAACSISRPFGSGAPATGTAFYTPGSPFTPDGAFPYTPYGGSTTYYIKGRFWSFGSGNPATGEGHDNGLLVGYSFILANYLLYVPTWMQQGGYYGGVATSLGGPDADWQAPGVDGCITDDGLDPGGIDADECQVVLLNDADPGAGYFAVLSTTPNANGEFDFTPNNGFPVVIPLAPVPRPTIVATGGYGQPAAIDLTLTVDPGSTAFGENGYFLQCHPNDLLVGYKLYYRNWALGQTPPDVFDSRALERWTWRWEQGGMHMVEQPPWQPLTPEVLPIGEQLEVTVPCPLGGWIAVASTLVFGGTEAGADGYELEYVSVNSSMIDCAIESPGVGRVPTTMSIEKSAVIPGDLILSWKGSCSPAALDYGIYEGTIGDWYSHTEIDCVDDGTDRVETVEAATGSRYYLVVPNDSAVEGSYGLDSGGAQRPVGDSVCRDAVLYGPCDP